MAGNKKTVEKKIEPKKIEEVKTVRVKVIRNIITSFGTFDAGCEYEVTESQERKLRGAKAVC